MSDAHAVGVPPDTALHAAQRLLDTIGSLGDGEPLSDETLGGLADVRLVAEALVGMGAQAAPVRDGRLVLAEYGLQKSGVAAEMEARSAGREHPPLVALAELEAARRWSALWRAKARDLRIDGKRVYELFQLKHDSETELLTERDELARREAALHAEVVRLRKALEAAVASHDRSYSDLTCGSSPECVCDWCRETRSLLAHGEAVLPGAVLKEDA